MDTTKAVTHVSLCAGYGGIDLGLRRAIPDLRTIAVAEIEAFACANLVAKMEAGRLDPAPIWTDLKTFPWSSFRGKVGILSGGYPCQPFSAAGKRLGADDPRHLWPFIAAGIAAMRPGLCFFENVEGHISLGLEQVLRDLQRLGYRCTFGVFSASEVGATHQRKRLFILAHDTSVGVQGYWAGRIQESFAHAGERLPLRGGHCWPSRPGQPQFYWEPPRVMGNAAQLQRNGGDDNTGSSARCETISQSGDASRKAAMGDAACSRTYGAAGKMDGEKSEKESGESKVGNTGQAIGNNGCRESRNQRQTEPALGGNADGPAGGMDYAKLCVSGDSRVDELRLLGNGVVPATAERAFNVLASRLFS